MRSRINESRPMLPVYRLAQNGCNNMEDDSKASWSFRLPDNSDLEAIRRVARLAV